MRKIDSQEAREHLDELIEEAAQGKEIVITRGDGASVRLVPITPFKAPPGSFLDGIEDLVGSVEGPPDLSTNPKYMEDFGKS